MPVVEVVETIPAPIHALWDIVNDVESFPRLMEHVRSLRILERGDGYRLTEWHVELKGCLMRWVEREELYPAKFRIEYRQLEGELAQFEGFWQLEPLPDGSTRVVLSVLFDIGIPMLSEMLNPVAQRAIQDNSRRMLLSVATEAASSAPGEESVPEVR